MPDWMTTDNSEEKARGGTRRSRARVVLDYVLGSVMRDYVCPGQLRKRPGAYTERMRSRLTPEENAVIQSLKPEDVSHAHRP